MKRGINPIKKDKSNIIIYTLKSFLILLFIIVLYNFFLLFFSAKTEKEAKYIFGFRAYVITTDSMKPNLNTGDIVIIKKAENDDLKIGDIITYRLSADTERITHRIVDKTDDIYVTKGDNNKLEDKSIVKYENIEGRVTIKIPFIGKIFLNIETLFYAVFLTITILTVYLYNRRLLNKSKIRREKKKYADSLRQEELLKNVNKEEVNKEKIKE